MDYALPVLFAITLWWLSTVVLLYRAGLPKASYPATLVGATAAMAIGLWAIVASRGEATNAGMYVAFSGALAVWGWHEVAYLFGFVSGPRPAACPAGVTGWQRFVFGVKACVYHELAVVATAGLIALVVWDSPNRVALFTFLILWLMRWSAKLNIFLGVRNLHAEYWPEHLAYLKSFVGKERMNGLFPISVAGACIGIASLGSMAAASGTGSSGRTGAMLLLTLLALALIEHCFLVLRVSDGILWQPGLRSRNVDGRPIPAKIQPRL